MSNMTGIYKTGNAYPSQAPRFTPIVLVGSLLFICSIFCVFIFLGVFFVFVLCLVCPMLHVSLDCPFLIALWIFPKFIQILKAIDLQTKHLSLKNQRDRRDYWICLCWRIRVKVMVFNTTFNNISVILWRSVLLVEEIGFALQNSNVTIFQIWGLNGHCNLWKKSEQYLN